MRERGGVIELPKSRLEPGVRVRVLQGPLQGQLGLCAGMRPRERVLVLLQLLGSQRRVELREDAVERSINDLEPCHWMPFPYLRRPSPTR